MNTVDIIESELQAQFAPVHLEVDDESHMHNVAPGAQSHFKVLLVAEAFENKPLKRHFIGHVGEIEPCEFDRRINLLRGERRAENGESSGECGDSYGCRSKSTVAAEYGRRIDLASA